jgi:SAM-dependent methyltransferase
MVEIARRRAAELGLQNVDFDVIDAQRMELEPASFDAVVCRWGYMLMADPDEAFRRTRRVLKEGGRLALATWDKPDRNLWMSAPVIALVSEGAMPPPNPGDPSPFAMPDPADIERRLQAAGFSSARAELAAFPQIYPSFEAYWEETIDMAAPIRGAVEGLEPDELAKIRTKTQETLSRFTGEDGRIEVPANAIVAAAIA